MAVAHFGYWWSSQVSRSESYAFRFRLSTVFDLTTSITRGLVPACYSSQAGWFALCRSPSARGTQAVSPPSVGNSPVQSVSREDFIGDWLECRKSCLHVLRRLFKKAMRRRKRGERSSVLISPGLVSSSSLCPVGHQSVCADLERRRVGIRQHRHAGGAR
jgi:hypothetical protein